MISPEDEREALRRAYAVAIDALYEVKETLAEALGLLGPQEKLDLLTIAERAYAIAADGCSTDLRNPNGYEAAVRRLQAIAIDAQGNTNGRLPTPWPESPTTKSR